MAYKGFADLWDWLIAIAIAIILFLIAATAFPQCRDDLHLYIVAGQSNASVYFCRFLADEVDGELGSNHTVHVRCVRGETPISAWDQAQGGWLYDKLIQRIDKAVSGRPLDTITLVWVHGATDAALGRVDTYLESFDAILDQLRRDLEREDIRLVIARTTDWRLAPEFQELRDLQVFIGETYENALGWVDTDDLNVGRNAHFTIKGYAIMAERVSNLILNHICCDGKRE